MTIRFDKVQSRGFAAQLRKYLKLLEAGKDLDHGTIRHVCGKLNWFSEVVQSGRIHHRSWWDYERLGARLYPLRRQALLQDTQWWITLLDKWSEGEGLGIEYPILSSHQLKNDKSLTYIVQSDASGEDGFGYFHGPLDDDNPRYVSMQWAAEFQFVHSMHGELKALEHWAVNNGSVKGKMLVWVSDSLSAVWAVNKGRCHDAVSLGPLMSILDKCDECKNQLVALWLPREENEFADYLSHLASLLNRESIGGRCQDLDEIEASGGPSVQNKDKCPTPAQSGEVRDLLQVPKGRSVAANLQKHCRIRPATRRRKSRIYPISGRSDVPSKSTLHAATDSMAVGQSVIEGEGNYKATEISGHLTQQTEEGAPASRVETDNQAAESRGSS